MASKTMSHNRIERFAAGLRWGAAAIAALVILGLWTPLFASPPLVQAEQGCSCYRVDAILIDGLLRTRRSVVERELTFGEGDVATIAEVEESVQRLRNTGLFRVVDYEFVDRRIGALGEESHRIGDEVEGRVLRVVVDERWTILPNFRFGQGGDTFHFLLGLQDANLFGSYLQLGGQYSRLGDANAFALWFRDPRFLNERMILSVDAAYADRTFSLYDRRGEREGGFTMNRKFAGASLEREWVWWLRNGLHLSYTDDAFSYRFVSEAIEELQDEASGLPEDVRAVNLAFSTRIGRVNQDNYRVRGTQLNLRLTQVLPLGGVDDPYRRFESYFFHFWSLPLKSDLGLRLGMGTNSSRQDQHLFYAGGLDTVRGVPNMRYRGPYYFLANMEWRVPSLDTRWLVVQHIFFADAVGVTPYPNEILGVSGASAGLGLRIISPKIYGFIIRVDYAFPVYDASGQSLSFGAGQFF
jgi:outer membrane protein assembly factor BamA